MTSYVENPAPSGGFSPFDPHQPGSPLGLVGSDSLAGLQVPTMLNKNLNIPDSLKYNVLVKHR
jgi:hypothetical protein